ncbi:hypothetical protein [Ideonella aquatica]|nr:hypothetical protein [Ideonella aquatica]
MRRLYTQLGVTYSKDQSGNFHGESRPRSPNKDFEIDTSLVELISAEHAAQLLATIDWINKSENETSNHGTIITSENEWQEPHVALRQRVNPSLKKQRTLIPARRREIPNLNHKSNKNSQEEKIKEILSIVREISQEISKELRAYDISFLNRSIIQDWAIEFIAETLLNVAQHSEITGRTTKVYAYIAATYTPAAEIKRAVLSQPLNSQQTAEIDWLERMNSTSPGCIEIAVSDIGNGIPNTIIKAYLESEKAREQRSPQWETEAVSHDDLLIWALSAFGTRKRQNDFPTKHDAITWRGLYRLLRRTTNYDGAIRLTSAAGEVACVKDRAGYRTKISSALARPPSPVTTLKASIPITPRQPTQNFHSVAVTNHWGPASTAGIIELPPEANLSNIETAEDIEKYLERIRAIVERAITSKPDDDRPWIIVHSAQDVFPTRNISKSISETGAEYKDAVTDFIQRVVSTTISPTHRLIHYGLPGSELDEVQDAVAEYLQTFVKSVHPYLVGSYMGQAAISFGCSSKFRWLSTHTESNKVDKKDQGSNLWYRLISYQPDTATSIRAPIGEFDSEIASMLATVFLNRRVRHEASLKARSSARMWFWKSKERNGEATHVVRTRSGTETTQFLSVIGFCDSHASFLYGLADAFLTAVKQWILSADGLSPTVFVIPDTETSHFLLNRVRRAIRPKLFADGRPFNLVFPDAVEAKTFNTRTVRCMIFADFRDSGDSARRRKTEVELILAPETEAAFRLFVAIDSDKNSKKADPNTSDMEAVHYFARYRYLDAGIPSSNSIVLSIDPVTNEPFSPEQTESSNLLTSISWRATESEELFDLSGTTFIHGIENIGGRVSTIRWPVKANLKNENVSTKILRHIEAFLASNETPTSICLCFRQESFVDGALSSVVDGLTEWISSPLRASPCTLWTAAVYTEIFHGRQNLGQAVHQALRTATLHTSNLKQWELPWGAEGSETSSKVEYSHIIYIDNSAVTGRAIQEFLLSMRSLPQYDIGPPKRILLFPIVTRLSPIEEGLLRSISLTNYPGMLPRSSHPSILIDFRSLVQLRIRSYASVKELPLYTELRRVLSTAESASEPEFRQISDSIRSVITSLDSAPIIGGQALHFGSVLGLAPTDSSIYRCLSLHAVEFRQLLSLLQQGVPCTFAALASIDHLRSVGDTGLLNILAFEPDLLTADPLMYEMLGAMRKYAVHTALNSTDHVLVTNAVWVLGHLPSGLASLLRADTGKLFVDNLTQRVFVYLSLYALDPHELSRVCKALLIKRERSEIEGWLLSHGLPLLLSSDSERRLSYVEVNTESKARELILCYLREGRSDHMGPMAENWRRAKEMFDSLAYKSRLPNLPASTFEAYVDAVESWVFQMSIPVQRSLEFLIGRTRSELRSKLEQERRQATEALENLRLCMLSLLGGSGHINNIISAWRNLTLLTLAGTTEKIYTRTDALTTINSSTSRTYRSPRVNATTFALTQFVNTPLLILASELIKGCDMNSDVDLHYDCFCDGGDSVSVTSKLVDLSADKVIVRAMWFTRKKLPLLWGAKSLDFRKVSSILADNLLRYSNPSARLKITMAMREVDGEHRVNIEIISLSKINFTPNNGLGREAILNIAKKNSWEFKDGPIEFLPNYYRSVIDLKVDLIDL